ncbi:hypothetical protein FHT86_005573 [Rhizobium sp. BK313]|uniref:hypothetical protein n=1 Tax=unclassified Rhizobium TaxID=2613769 RepID=UPI0010446D9C|nr:MULTISPECIES: hypothetical protein [unclassified Rhizobium]MBB3457255.1 hypothetical protein [Rhizobium sp. BK313]
MLARNTSLHQVLDMGFAVWNDWEVNTGWRHISITNILILGRPASAMLSFFREELKKVFFVLLDQDRTDPEKVRQHHDKVLIAAFGPPHSRDIHGFIKYAFAWGSIESSYDPRGVESNIILTWT